MSKDNHLPVYGVGPLLVFPILAISVAALVLTYFNFIPKYEIPSLNFLLTILGIVIIILGATYWISAVKSRIDVKIKSNQLETTGIYSIIRHPIYAAFLYVSTGLILMSQNIYLFFLPVFYWAFLSIALKNTEEKWLNELYGEDYINYSKNVNRFIPKMVR